ncbi:XRE family transcriptional regulator [Ruminococcus sp. AF41-9]|nr:XRE family transcriptional regulator [Ruminococcus sp. AF41-9]
MESEIRIKFGRTLRRLRKNQGVSQEAFADKCDLHRTYVSDVERGERNISLENIEKIAKVLNVKISELFREVENESDSI